VAIYSGTFQGKESCVPSHVFSSYHDVLLQLGFMSTTYKPLILIISKSFLLLLKLFC
jgi:hypothetical protein